MLVDVINEINFWVSLRRGSCRRKKEGGQIQAELWAIWLNQNEVRFRGRLASMDSVFHEVEGLMAFWFS